MSDERPTHAVFANDLITLVGTLWRPGRRESYNVMRIDARGWFGL
jgi:hypothetical protein